MVFHRDVVFEGSILNGDVEVEVVREDSGRFLVWGVVVVDREDLGGVDGVTTVEDVVGEYASEADARWVAEMFLSGGWRDWADGEG